jgi:hypothetical protein
MDIFSDTFSALIKSLNKNNVDYLLIGGYAVVLHGYNRFTADMDILFKPDIENGKKLLQCIQAFGYDVSEFERVDLTKEIHFRIGEQPDVVDLINTTIGIDFTTVFERGTWMKINELDVKVIHINDLISNKKALNTFKDLADAEELIKIKKE